MFEKNLLYLKQELKLHKRDREYLLKYYIQKRLNLSLSSYFKNLESSAYAISVADPNNVLKEL